MLLLSPVIMVLRCLWMNVMLRALWGLQDVAQTSTGVCGVRLISSIARWGKLWVAGQVRAVLGSLAVQNTSCPCTSCWTAAPSMVALGASLGDSSVR